MAKKTRSNLSGSDTNENIPHKATPATKTRGEPNPDKFYHWTVRLGVSAIWVADGFSLDDGRAHDMLAEHISHAYGHELTAEVLVAPPPAAVAGEQGYSTVEEAHIAAVDYIPRRQELTKKAAALAEVFLKDYRSLRAGQQTQRERLTAMVELLLCRVTGIPWDGNPNSTNEEISVVKADD